MSKHNPKEDARKRRALSAENKKLKAEKAGKKKKKVKKKLFGKKKKGK